MTGTGVGADVDERLEEVVRACEAIERYVEGADPSDVVLDAVRMRLIEIGAVVAALPDVLTASEPEIPWARLAGVGDRLTGRCRAVTPSVLLGTARVDVPRLREAAERLRASGASSGNVGGVADPAG
ncbi:HepT-like ribonuclease domain-containing protein [Curtobacterium oceanosedimentum]|uniref:HepT-like ribonuclease domain-containing protein n=1 Tax=Curtobacterium oceanosedimentum TaxID=465820 RepID=UPI00339808C6